MAHLNLNALEDELYSHLGLDIATDQADLSLDEADRLINRSFLFMLNQVKFKFVEKTVTFDVVGGQRTYHLPDDLSSLKVLSIVEPASLQHIRLNPMISREYENRYNEDATAQAFITHYVRECDIIRLFPTPDQTYTLVLKYDNVPELYSNSNATQSGLPEEYEEAVLMGAVYRGFFKTGDYVRGPDARQEALGLVKGLITQEEDEKEDSSLDGLDMAWGPNLETAKKNSRNFNSAEDTQRNR